jgi:hypothetical protein
VLPSFGSGACGGVYIFLKALASGPNSSEFFSEKSIRFLIKICTNQSDYEDDNVTSALKITYNVL